MGIERCHVARKLVGDVETILATISDLTGRQLAIFRNGADWPSVMKLDKELELAVGEKERLFGALRQHRAEHGCG